MKKKNVAVVLAAGSGSRMQAAVKKQFMEISGKPLFYYSVAAFERCADIDEIVLVTGEPEISLVASYIKTWGIQKVSHIVAGGKERYHSVWNALHALKCTAMPTMPAVSEAAEQKKMCAAMQPGVVLIHDSARPMLNEEMIQTALRGAQQYEACVIGVPVKDTIKILDAEQYVAETPDRRTLWAMQTPQAFSYALVYAAYEELIFAEKAAQLSVSVTDDAMVVEHFAAHTVKVLQGDYRNIKVTTPEDLVLAELYLAQTAEKK